MLSNYFKTYVLYPMAEKKLGRDIRSKLKNLRLIHTSSPEIKAERQKKQLHEIIQIAQLKVPYYNDLFKKINFNPENILKSIEYIKDIPLLDKEILREQGTRMLNQDFDPKSLHVRETNGSTGLVTNMYYDQQALDWTAAVNLFASEFCGRRQTDTEVHLTSQLSEKAEEAFFNQERLKCWALNRVNIYTKTFDEEGLNKLLTDIKSARAYSVQGHPSTLYHLALQAKKNQGDFNNLFTSFESTGESIDLQKVKVIEETFGCKVYNRLGNAEFGVFAHSRDNYNELEVLDYIVYPESHSLGNGLEEIILTGLTNKSMPLIRYKTGDVGEVFYKNNLPHVKGVHGRIHDIVNINGTDYPTHFIKDLLEKIGGVDEFQIVEKKFTPERKTLRIVPSPYCNKIAIESSLCKTFGEDTFKIEYTSFDGLTLLGWRDKFSYLVRG